MTRRRRRVAGPGRPSLLVAGAVVWATTGAGWGAFVVPRPVTTVAGTGEAGADGDGGPAHKARFDEPRTAAPDGGGNRASPTPTTTVCGASTDRAW